MLEPLLTDLDLEQLRIMSQSKAQKDRVAGRGIPFVKIGRLVRYRPADVEKFLSDLPTLCSTSEAGANVVQAGIEQPPIAKAEPASGPIGGVRRSGKRSTPPSATRRERGIVTTGTAAEVDAALPKSKADVGAGSVASGRSGSGVRETSSTRGGRR